MPRTSLWAIVFALCLVPAAASGETILVTITSGNAQVGAGADTIAVSGTSGFSLNAALGFGNSCLTAFCTVEPGDPLPFSSGWVGLDILHPTVTLNGVTYTDVAGLNSPDTLSFAFDGATTIAPPVQPGPTTVQAPFTFSGTFVHAGNSEGDGGFIAELTGQGTATLSLFGLAATGDTPAVWNSSAITWEFAAVSTEPVPEPGTITLIGFGVAGAWGAARRRRRVRGARL